MNMSNDLIRIGNHANQQRLEREGNRRPETAEETEARTAQCDHFWHDGHPAGQTAWKPRRGNYPGMSRTCQVCRLRELQVPKGKGYRMEGNWILWPQGIKASVLLSSLLPQSSIPDAATTTSQSSRSQPRSKAMPKQPLRRPTPSVNSTTDLSDHGYSHVQEDDETWSEWAEDYMETESQVAVFPDSQAGQ